jgi:hypothetical protein
MGIERPKSPTSADEDRGTAGNGSGQGGAPRSMSADLVASVATSLENALRANEIQLALELVAELRRIACDAVPAGPVVLRAIIGGTA